MPVCGTSGTRLRLVSNPFFQLLNGRRINSEFDLKAFHKSDLSLQGMVGLG